MRVRVLAPAKVNLFLYVKGLLTNGFHDLEMLMERIGLSDEIIVEDCSSGISLEVEGQKDIGSVEDNLVYRAAKLFTEYHKINKGHNITLYKKIPVAAGLGGGSSDGAAVLRALNLKHPLQRN